jgi:hypothetical protein
MAEALLTKDKLTREKNINIFNISTMWHAQRRPKEGG